MSASNVVGLYIVLGIVVLSILCIGAYATYTDKLIAPPLEIQARTLTSQQTLSQRKITHLPCQIRIPLQKNTVLEQPAEFSQQCTAMKLLNESGDEITSSDVFATDSAFTIAVAAPQKATEAKLLVNESEEIFATSTDPSGWFLFPYTPKKQKDTISIVPSFLIDGSWRGTAGHN